MQFASLHLSAPILRALTDEGYKTPTPIQAQAIGPIMDGKDMLGCAQTGTGKTAAFALPILHRLTTAPVDKSRRGPVFPRALILSPTRELAGQIDESFRTYGRHTHLQSTVIFGGVSQFHQVRALQRGVDILVATPGRLMDLMEQRRVNLSEVGIFVLDEADRMLDMGFINPIRRIAKALPTGRQTLMFSATMPREIMSLADSLLRDPVKVAVTPVASAAPLIEQSIYMVRSMQKQSLLEFLLKSASVSRVLVFTRTKHGADKVCKRLSLAGITADAIHGNKAQNRRERALDSFRSGRARVLVATDVAARGLDVDNITHVINFDLPNEPEAYVHRIGRTGRAGATGLAISFCDGQSADERGYLRDIERLTGKKIPSVETPANLPAAAPLPRTEQADRPMSNGAPYGGRGHSHRTGSGSHRTGGQHPTRSSHRQPAAGSNGSHAPHAPGTPHTPGTPRGPHAPRSGGAPAHPRARTLTGNSRGARRPSRW